MKKIVLILIMFTFSCAHHPLPEDSCALALSKVEASNTPNVLRITHRACMHFENTTGYTPDMSRVSVTVSVSESSRAILKNNPEIFVNHLSDTWERELMHEIWHVLLWRSEPELDINQHHTRMLHYRLCHPIQLCGYGHDHSMWE